MKFRSPIDVDGYISLITQNPGTTPTKYLIQDANGKIAFRTGQELRVDIGAQAALSGTGFIKISGNTISYDNNSYYLSSNPAGYITSSGSITGNAATATNADYANAAGYAGNADTVDNYHASSFAKQAYVNIGYNFNTLAAENSDSAIVYRLESSVTNPPNNTIYNWSLWQQGNATRGSQIAVGAYGGNEIYFRGANADTGSYRGWQRVLHDGNYSTYAVPLSRTITINGTSYDLSANRSWTVTANAVETDTLATVTARGATTSTRPSFDGGITVNGQSYVTNSGYFVSGANGFRWNDSSGSYNNVIMRDNGTTWFRNYLETPDSMRSPIYYDYNDTSYYVDPAGNGTRAAVFNGNLWITPKSESYGEGVTFNMPTQGTWGGLRWYRNGSAGGYAGNWAFGYFGNESNNDVGFHNGTNGWRLDHSFNMTSIGSVRSPIFYDSNNTANYVDPNSTSNLYIMQAYSYQGNGNVGGTGAASWHPSGIYCGSTMWQYGDMYKNNSSIYDIYNGFANSSLRAPIFYDINDTGYYVDPASSSNVNNLTVAGTFSGANNVVYGDGPNGRSKNNTNANTSDSSNSSGFYYGNGVTGMPGTDWWNWLTVAGNSWSGSDGYRWQMTGSFWSDDWRLRRMTSGGWNGWVSLLHSGNYTSYRDWGGNAIYAGILYDGNNTGYYVDPNSASNMSSVYVDNWFRTYGKVGMYSQSYGVHIYPYGSEGWAVTGSGGNVALQFRSNHETSLRGYVYADTSNNIGFLNNGGNWSFRVDSSGNATATGDVTAYSDKRVKENVITLDNALDKVLSLRGVYYNRIDSEDKQRKVGVIAQETLEVLPEVVGKDTDGMYNVAYGNITAVLIEAIKEQQTQIEELKQLVNQLINK